MPSGGNHVVFLELRRLSAIDVDKVAGAVDVLTLQENIMNITFCKLEDEKCPHCQSGVDPVLLKLIRLAQLTIEYLLHSQEFLTSQLHGLEERLRRSSFPICKMETMVLHLMWLL